MDLVKHNRARAILKLEFVKTYKRFFSNEKRLKVVRKIPVGSIWEIKSKFWISFSHWWHESVENIQTATDDDDH